MENTMENEEDYITLKWGTLKSWKFTDPVLQSLLKEYNEEGSSLSAMMQQDTPRQKKIICEMIDTLGKPVYNSWSDEYMGTEEAKRYIMDYDK